MLGFAALGEIAIGEGVALASTNFVAAGATLTISGQDAGLYATRYMTVDAGAFALTGMDANLTAVRTIAAEAGVFTLTFLSAELRRSVRLINTGGGTRGLAARAGGSPRGLRIRA